MTLPCASHPDSIATGHCSACGRPFCANCVVEDIPSELSFCSKACLDSQAFNPQPSGRTNADLIDGLSSPIRAGWKLWLGQAVPLTIWIGVPIGIAFGLLRFATASVTWNEALTASIVSNLVLLVCASLAAAAAAVLLSRAHTGLPSGSPWTHVASRFLPWAITWILFIAALVLGISLLVIPGIIASIRLFWADEFALIHGKGPVASLRESMKLTRGLTGSVFKFQFILGFAEYLVLIPLAIGSMGVELFIDSSPNELLGTVLYNTFVSILGVNAYASMHAPEIVYFYGIRALRAEMPAEEIQGDWVSKGTRGNYGSDSANRHSCPSCGSAWDPADYREDVAVIYCSTCKTQLTRPE